LWSVLSHGRQPLVFGLVDVDIVAAKTLERSSTPSDLINDTFSLNILTNDNSDGSDSRSIGLKLNSLSRCADANKRLLSKRFDIASYARA